MSRFHNKKQAKAHVRLPDRKNTASGDEYGKSEKGISICPRCHNVLFKKEWHHPGTRLVEHVGMRGKEVRFRTCPACHMIEKGLYEGELIIDGVPEKYEAELVNAIASYGKRATGRDPQDRIIEMKKGKRFVIYTTENQLAIKIARHIQKAFKKTTSDVSLSKEPYEVARIKMSFRGKV